MHRTDAQLLNLSEMEYPPHRMRGTLERKHKPRFTVREEYDDEGNVIKRIMRVTRKLFRGWRP